jgi:hypothetical protein
LTPGWYLCNKCPVFKLLRALRFRFCYRVFVEERD